MFGPWVDEGVPQYDDPNLTLTAYPSGREGGYTIPRQVNGRTVDRIWASAFSCAERLTDIGIPETVKIIGGNAFEKTGLTDVNYSQVSRHKKAHFFRGAGYFVCSQYKASASFGVSILSVPCGLFVL